MNTNPVRSTRPRSFDYIQLQWLAKTTGRPSHDWDLYVVKELLDNALDADDHWVREQGYHIELSASMIYRETGSLEVAVCNRSPFPTEDELLSAIFDLSAYTTNKGHTNYPTRGEQGNALKTLLGIPYALRRELVGDYSNIHKPLVIETGGRAYVISLDIDEAKQHVRLAPIQDSPLVISHDGTCVKVGIDRFRQERPRSIDDLHDWAQRFALFNPHATFKWHIKIGAQREDWEFPANPDWSGPFSDTAPVHWYEYTQLRELLYTLQRDQGSEMPLSQALQRFAGYSLQEDPDGQKAQALCTRLGFRTIADLKLADHHGSTLRDRLWPALLNEGRTVPTEALGGLGQIHLTETLALFFGLETPPIYRQLIHDDPGDPAHPFVLELALARLPLGKKRVIWTGLNHSPTYEDPFFTAVFHLLARPDESVYGLDGVCDVYGQTSEQPVLLVMHIICPNLAYQEFSKTRIDPRSFRQPLANLLDDIFDEFTRVERVEIEDLQVVTHALLPEAVQRLTPNGSQQFTISQLLRAVRHLLIERLTEEGRAEFIESWLADVGAPTRLQTYVQSYVQQNPDIRRNLIRVESGRLTIPVHPNGHTTLSLSQLGRRLFDDACVNKLLLVVDPEMEAVIVANGLLARFDMALLRAERNFDSSFEELLEQMNGLDIPLVLLHHATPNGCLLGERLQARLDQTEITGLKLYDLGLTPAQGQELGMLHEYGTGGGDAMALARYLSADEVTFLTEHRLEMSLFALPIHELADWLEKRFSALGIPSKTVPEPGHLKTESLTTMKRMLSDWVIGRFHQLNQVDFMADQAMTDLMPELNANPIPSKLEDALKIDPMRDWKTTWAELVSHQCQNILAEHQERIDALIEQYRPSS